MKKLILAILALLVALLLFVVLRSQREHVPDVSSTVTTPVEVPADNPSAAPEKEIAKTPETQPSFRQVADQAWKKIPKKLDLQQVPKEEMHHTPRLVQTAALALGDVAQLLHDKPEYRRDGFQFYQKCALESEFPMSIRAVCLSGYRKMAEALGERVEEDAVSPQIRALTDRIDH